MSDIHIDGILEGTPHKVALAYLNTLRHLYYAIAPKVRNIDWHLGRIADEYCTTDLEDGIAISREVTGLVNAVDKMAERIDSLEKAVARLVDGNEEAK